MSDRIMRGFDVLLRCAPYLSSPVLGMAGQHRWFLIRALRIIGSCYNHCSFHMFSKPVVVSGFFSNVVTHLGISTLNSYHDIPND